MSNSKRFVIHTEIQPIIHENIQPIIIVNVQPIINQQIQPYIFKENQPNIDEEIERLNHAANKQNAINNSNYEKEFPKEQAGQKATPPTNPFDKKKPKLEEAPKPIFKGNVVSYGGIQHYIKRVEMHNTRTIPVPTELNKTVHLVQLKYVPYVIDKNGKISPYEKKQTTLSVGPEIMEKIVAFNFVSREENITYPMACPKKDIFANAEKKLYKQFPQLKSKKIYFIANGNVINRSLTIAENKIENGTAILIKVQK